MNDGKKKSVLPERVEVSNDFMTTENLAFNKSLFLLVNV